MDVKLKIKKRLERYLELDSNGIRRYLMELLIQLKKFTVHTLYQVISQRFKVSYSTVAAMVGYIHSKLGLLHAHKDSYKTPTIYSLKDEYVDIIKTTLKTT